MARRGKQDSVASESSHGSAAQALWPEQRDLLHGIRLALDAAHPLVLLELVSSVVAALDPRGTTPLEHPDSSPRLTLEHLLESFFEISQPETSAFLAVVAGTTDDELLRARIRTTLTARADALPEWLRKLELESCEVAELSDPLGDGDDLFAGVRVASRHDFTLVVYIDHNVGTVVKDACAIPQPCGTVLSGLRADVAGADRDIHPFDAADARARIADAVAKGALTHPPFETATWPACRPLLEWVLRTMPAGGRGDRRPQWSGADLRALSDDFVCSEYGRGWGDPDAVRLLGSLFRFATDYGSGDPMRWSPVVVEIVLEDWVPRTLLTDSDQLARIPDLLRAYIPYCHRRRGVRAGLTAETVAAVDRYEDGYQKAIREPRDPGLLAVLDRVSTLGRPGAHSFEDDLETSFEEYMLHSLTRAVGGMVELDRLDTRPLDDEAFGWEWIPADVRERVTEVLALCDGFCADQMDGEFRTACRRLLADVAASDPAIFRRKGAANRAGAAICWLVGKANGILGYRSTKQSKDILEWFGANGPVSARAEVMLRAIGVDPSSQYGIVDLGSPRYLTAERRARIIARRDHYRARTDVGID